MAEHNDFGLEGERFARQFLEANGYSILEINWRHRRYEVDIIARKANTISLIEVKSRNAKNITAEEVVSFEKETNLINAADAFMSQLEEDLECRIDLIILEKKDPDFSVTHIENAITI